MIRLRPGVAASFIAVAALHFSATVERDVIHKTGSTWRCHLDVVSGWGTPAVHNGKGFGL